MRNAAGVSAEEFASGSLFHRTLECMYDIVHDADKRGLKETNAAVKQANLTLILIAKKFPGKFTIPAVIILPRDV